ncbi:50S ribosomal protein L22 [Flexistipes sp.]|uniref:50S ribosomal protein L22 n=1 Tax=Flexistipes sp. TaxID=3088135 RepID=UPI002E23F567|nr:50S ribosomal protein L22 [Flexistipes sp.]
MDVQAKGRYVRVSPRKARLVADLVRGKSAEAAIDILNFTPKKAAKDITKVIKSAVSNAEENHGVRDVSGLKIKEIRVDGGPILKRYMPRAYGRATMIRKRTSHITVVLSE